MQISHSLKFLTFFLFSVGVNNVAAQKQLADADELFGSDHFTVGVTGGFGTSYFQQTFGNDVVDRYHNIPFGVNFKYGMNLNPTYGLEFGAGFGMHSTGNEWNPFSFMSWWSGYSTLSADFIFRIPVDERRTLRLKTGVALWSFGKGTYGAGSTILSGDTNNVVEYNSQVDLTNHGSRPAFRAGLGLTRQLSNNDLLTLDLGAELFLQPMYSGDYTVWRNGIMTGQGKIRSSLTYFSMALGYTFTYVDRDQKRQTNAERGLTTRESRRTVRAERRKLSPTAWRIGLSGGFFANTTEVISDEGGYFRDQANPSFQPHISFEKGLTRGFFAEAAFNTVNYMFSNRVKGLDFWSGSGSFRDFQVLLGGGYRVIGPRNYRYIDVSAGIGLHANRQTKGVNGWGSGVSGYTSGTTTWQMTDSYVQNDIRNYFVTAYLGLSKDFQITKNLCFTAAFRQQIGFMAAALEYHTYNVNGSEFYDATMALKGKGSAYTIGLKYTFDDGDSRPLKP